MKQFAVLAITEPTGDSPNVRGCWVVEAEDSEEALLKVLVEKEGLHIEGEADMLIRDNCEIHNGMAVLREDDNVFHYSVEVGK